MGDEGSTTQDPKARAKKKAMERLARRAASSARVRAEIERQNRQRELDRENEMRATRLAMVKSGADALKREDIPAAIKAFLMFLRMLELTKKVEPGRLHPNLFDPKKDLSELVLITGIYWDLARSFDRLRGKKSQDELKKYLHQYVVFAKAAPFRALCAETMRKYLITEKPTHRAEFRAAYKQMGGSTCFIASSLLDLTHLETSIRLRAFRDQVLLPNPVGGAFVRYYEACSPAIAKRLDRSPFWVRWVCARAVDFSGWWAGVFTPAKPRS